jgi:hypothetical protein
MGAGQSDFRYGVKAGATKWFDTDRNLRVVLGVFAVTAQSSHRVFAGGPPTGFVFSGHGVGASAEAWVNAGPVGIGLAFEHARTSQVTNVVQTTPRTSISGIAMPVKDHNSVYVAARVRGWLAGSLLGVLVVSRFLQDGPLLPCC